MRPPAHALAVGIGNAAVGNLGSNVSVDENQYARSTAADKR
jgi:hypothetical protein